MATLSLVVFGDRFSEFVGRFATNLWYRFLRFPKLMAIIVN